MKRAFRFWYTGYGDEERFLKLLRDHAGDIDEISMNAEPSHMCCGSIEYARRQAARMKDLMEKARACGIRSVGVNRQSVIGHMDEAWDCQEAFPFRTMVGDDGATTRSCACIRDEGYLERHREIFRTYAQAGPDFLWFDDDVRFHAHMNIHHACFCPECVKGFSERTGRKFTRESLTQALRGERALREEWHAYNREALARLSRIAREAVDEVDPSIEIGYMLLPESYTACCDGGATRTIVENLKTSRVRPGFGFFNDNAPRSVFAKMCAIQEQNAVTRDCRDRLYEVEDFPFQADKSLKAQTVEITLALMCGCNGYMMSTAADKPLTRPWLFESLRTYRRLWEHMEECLGGMEPAGAGAAFDPVRACDVYDMFAADQGRLIHAADPLMSAGIPVAAGGSRIVSVLTGDMTARMDREDLIKTLEGSVLMDGRAAEELDRLGLGDLCGCSVSGKYDNGVVEWIHWEDLGVPDKTDDMRNGFMNAFPTDETAYTFRLQEGARPLTTLRDYTGRTLGTGTVLFENRLGGKAAVLGYMPLRYTRGGAYSAFLRRACDMLTDETMPVRLDTDGGMDVVPFVARNEKGMMISLTNGTLDTSLPMKMRVRCPAGSRIFRLLLDGGEKAVPVERREKDAEIQIGSMQPWETAVYRVQY